VIDFFALPRVASTRFLSNLTAQKQTHYIMNAAVPREKQQQGQGPKNITK
jgi:hypothetical protein